MEIEKYKLDLEELLRYLGYGHTMNFILDFTALLRAKADFTLRQLAEIPRSRGCWYVIPKFESQIDALLETGSGSNAIFFYTDRMLDSLEACWEAYSSLPVHLGDDVSSASLFFQKLVKDGKESCLVTGNETEAWRHILGRKRGHILLITDEEAYYIPEVRFPDLMADGGRMLPETGVPIQGLSGNLCRTDDGKTIKFEDILSDTSAEGTLFLAGRGKNVVKIFQDQVGNRKLEKLRTLLAFPDRKENLAWPEGLVYPVSDDGNPDPVGFIMPRMRYEFLLEEIFTLEVDHEPISDHARWKIAVSLLAQVLFLYLHGIQVGDYNPNNFCVTENCDVILMDMDSYVIGQRGTQMKGGQAIPFSVDYSRRKDVIKADYVYLTGTVFSIITDGYWPFFYNEDTGLGEYRFTEDENLTQEYKNALEQIPEGLKNYFSKVLERQEITDPFELYFLLLENEPKGPGASAGEGDLSEQSSAFARMLGKIKEFFA